MEDERKKEGGTAVGQYYLMEKVAQGGMAEIYRGLSYDVHGLKKTVCIKKILPHLAASEEFIESLVSEAKLAVKLVHGNIAQTFDLGKVGGDYFMVMEYVDGKSLSQIHKRCQAGGELIPIPHLLYFISEVLNGLDYMHRRIDEAGGPLHIVHRDISPQNIMVSYSGTVKIIDFGIAKVAYKLGSTDSGMLKGKFAYMSPEQALGDEIDRRSDIFSLGIILHEMLTGSRLFKAPDSRETIRNVRRARVAPPSSIRQELPDELDAIALKALAKDRRGRYPSAADMHEALVKYLHAHHPDFKPSDAAAFVHELFKDEKASPPLIEADAKTPHLIIDRSNSALADDSQFEVTGHAKAPFDLKEYMLEEEGLDRGEGGEEEIAGGEAAGGEVPGSKVPDWGEEEKTATNRLLSRIGGWRGAAIKGAGACGAIVAVIAAAMYLTSERPEVSVRPSSAAGLMVKTEPADASVSLDGRGEGSGSPVTMKGVSPDEWHTLRVSKEGFVPREERIKLKAGEFASLSISLSPAAKPEAALDISTTPPGAEIFMGDRKTGLVTPAALKDLKPGEKHVIGLHLAGHRFWSKELSLKAGEARSLDVALAPDFGSLFVDSSPQGALVLMDGTPIGQTPLTREGLEPGKVYRIEIWEKGFGAFSEEVRAEAGRREEIRAMLTPEKGPSEKGSDAKRDAPIIQAPAPADNPR